MVNRGEGAKRATKGEGDPEPGGVGALIGVRATESTLR